MSLGNVIFVDDDELLRVANSQSLTLAGFSVETYPDAMLALAAITAEFDGVVVSDIRMPEMDGIQLFKAIQKIDADIPVILITGHGDVPMAVSSLKAGVHDFLTKPFAADHLIASVLRAANLRELLLDNRRLQRAADNAAHKSPLIGETPVMVRLREQIVQIATANVDVIIEGETGTGKELVANMLHRAGPRRPNAFVSVSCSSASPDLVEAEMFGDAASGTIRSQRTCQVEVAHKGTLFLDDVDCLSLSAQSRLLRVMDGGAISTVPSDASRPVDIKIIASCKLDLLQAVREDRFREDLYYRLDMARLRLVPLRQRKPDLPLLFAHFVNEAMPRNGGEWPVITEEVKQHLYEHAWPGNARELKTFATRFVLGLVEPDDVMTPTRSLSERVRLFEASLLRDVLTQCEGDVTLAIANLQLPLRTFYEKLSRHGIDITKFRPQRQS